MKILSFIAIYAVLIVPAAAQYFTFGKPTPQEFQMKKYEQDTSANAVVLREYGTAWVSSTDVNDQYEELLSFFQRVSDEDSVQVFLEKI